MKDKITLIICYSIMYAGFHAWTDNTERGRALKKYLQEWNTDWKHGLLCSVTVFIYGCLAIFALGMTLHILGI